MKKIIKIGIFFLAITYLIIMLMLVTKYNKNNFCHKINIVIKDSNEYQFINSKEILKFLFDKNFEILGKPINKIKISLIEEQINKFPEVKKATVYVTDNGIFNIEVIQFKPILKILDVSYNNYFIDIEGNILHSNRTTPKNTLFANGFIPPIPEKFKNIKDFPENSKLKIINDLYVLSKFINSNEFWKAQIQQLYVNNDHEFELIPRFGPHIIIFGDLKNFEEKFENLYLFYKEALTKIGWNDYKYINLKFKNQIVCTKN